MMSQTSAEINADINPGYEEVRIEKCLDAELLDGWEKWSLKDVIRTINIMKGKISNKKSGYGMVLKFFGQIILNKILEAAGNPTTPFNLIKETVSVVLESEVSVGEKSVLDFYKGFEENSRQHLCNFFGALVKYGEKDVRYYDLIYTMLTFQRPFRESFPLGFCMQCPEFAEQVLAKLPPKMREKLERETTDVSTDGDITTYNLLEGYSLWM